MERLGETVEFRSLLLDLLRLNGWVVDSRPAFAGAGVLIIASRNGIEVRRYGRSETEIAVEVFSEASRVQGLRAVDEPLQLELV